MQRHSSSPASDGVGKFIIHSEEEEEMMMLMRIGLECFFPLIIHESSKVKCRTSPLPLLSGLSSTPCVFFVAIKRGSITVYEIQIAQKKKEKKGKKGRKRKNFLSNK